MTKREERKTLSRELILRTAYDLFASKGIVETSTLQIAQAANLSHGSIFAHFSNRDALVLAVIDEFGKRLAEELHVAMKKSSSLKSLLQSHLVLLQEFEPFYKRLVMEGALLSESVRNRIFLIQSGLASYLGKALEEERAAAAMEPIALPMFLNTWLGLVHYYLSHSDRFSDGASVLEEQGDNLVNFMINNFVKNKDSK